MNNRRCFFSLCVCLAFLLGWGCSLVAPPPVDPGKSADPSGTVSSQDPTSNPPTGDEAPARLVEEPVEAADFTFPSLGSIAFDLDTSITAGAEFYPGSEAVLELTDSAGLSWKLAVPGLALDTPHSLKMTALSSLSSSSVPGLVGGVLLEPDGLEFFLPPTLTISGAGLDGPVIVLTGKHDGSEVDVAYVGEEPGSAQLDHFSSAFVIDPDEDPAIQTLYDKLDASEKALIAQAKQVLADPNIDVPVPPSIPVECTDEKEQAANEKKVEEFIKAVYSPEGPLISELLAIKRGKALLGRPIDDTYAYENRLIGRLIQKARLLINTYYGQTEKLIPVSRTALKIAREAAILGSNTGQGDSALFLDEIGKWCDRSIDKLIDDVITQHDYRKAEAVWTVAHWAALLGVENHSAAEIQRKLEGALTFQLKTSLNLFITVAHDWEVQSEFQVKYRPDQASWGMLTGSGQGELISYNDIYAPDKQAQASPFAINARFENFDACAGTANLVVDRYYPDSETYIYDDGDTQVLPLIVTGWTELFRTFAGDGGYSFPVTVRNQQEIAVEEAVEGDGSNSGGEAGCTFEVTLTHTPVQVK